MKENRNWPARPTVYEGREFRSRLEAKWAAFFDQIGWQWEYEPEAISGWMPDFLLYGPHGRVYVEVKPDHLVEGAKPRVARAMREVDGRRFGLVVGERPRVDGWQVWLGDAFGQEEPFDGDEPIHWSWGKAWFVAKRREHPLNFDLLSYDLEDGCLLSCGNECCGNVCVCDDTTTNRYWNQAASQVMWRP